MKDLLKIVSIEKSDLGMTLNSWETLPLFEAVIETEQYLFDYTVDGYVITLNERGTYKITTVVNLTTDSETSVGLELRLELNGTPLETSTKGYTENTITLIEYITIAEQSQIVIQAYATTDDTPLLESGTNSFLTIQKLI